jgi:hypothetical protein
VARLTKTLITKRDRALAGAEKALSTYNETIDAIVDDMQNMADEIRAAFDKAEVAADKAHTVLEEVREYCLDKQEAAERKEDESDADAWAEIADSHDVDCHLSPSEPAELSDSMEGADLSCLVTDFADEV